ncbi:MAG: histidinol-phosphatase [Mariniphaga sp.]|nr:histidinol-phosphatase [Mariniphaga sp.]
MKRIKIKFLILALVLITTLPVFSQVKKNSLKLPVIPGYELLKCDFHMHTVFSDGMVWPTTRVLEAYQEGLDAIALTEHIEYQPKSEDFSSKDHMRSFQIAEKTAADCGIILIKATEITRKMAPGHFNALFIKDANIFETFVNKTNTRDGSNIVETLGEAKKQGAFVFWNHPWFQHPENRSEWQPIHEELYQKGLISGIEVVNGERYDSLVYKWCLDKNLTIMSNSDIHTPMVQYPGQYRAMTLVLAKERSEKGIQEALVDHRTIACMDGQLFGKSEWVKPLVENSLIVKSRQINDKSASLEIENISGIAYQLVVLDSPGIKLRLNSHLNIFTIDAFSQNAITVSSSKFVKGEEYSVKLNVLNVQVAAGKPLEYVIKFRL